MGLFHKTLGDVKKSIGRKDYSGALAIIDEHISAEKKTENDLQGLQIAIRDYQQQLKDLKGLLLARGKIEKGITEAVGRGKDIIPSTERSYQEQLEKKIQSALNNNAEIGALLAKLWRKDRKGLE